MLAFGIAGGILFVIAALVGCGQGGPQATARELDKTADRMTVAVSIAPQAWLVEQVGRAHVKVITMVRTGQSPATYQPADAQISAVFRAAVYFRIGVPFEDGRWFEALKRSNKLKIVDMRQGIRLQEISSHDQEQQVATPQRRHHHGKDPHIWVSPHLLMTMAHTVANELIELDPTHRTDYQRNLAMLIRDLDEVDAIIGRKLEPLKGSTFFVFHPAWGYFAREYGLRQRAIEVEGKQPTDYELTQLQKTARDAGVRVIFVQPQISSRLAQAVAKAIGAKVQLLDPLAADVSANLLRVAEALVESEAKP